MVFRKYTQLFTFGLLGLVLAACSSMNENPKINEKANASEQPLAQEDIKNVFLNDFSRDQVSSLFNWLQLRGCLILKVVQSDDYHAQLSCKVEYGSDIQARIFQWADKNNVSIQQFSSAGLVFSSRRP